MELEFADNGGYKGMQLEEPRLITWERFSDTCSRNLWGCVGVMWSVNAGDRSVSMQVHFSSSFLSCCPWELMSVKLPLLPSCWRGALITVCIKILIWRNISCSWRTSFPLQCPLRGLKRGKYQGFHRRNYAYFYAGDAGTENWCC